MAVNAQTQSQQTQSQQPQNQQPPSEIADKKNVECAQIKFTMWHRDYVLDNVPVGSTWESVCKQIAYQLDTGVLLFRGDREISPIEIVLKDETISVQRKPIAHYLEE
jgi:hypothetical protein